MKFLSVNIEHSTNLIENLLKHLENNDNREDVDILLRAAENENSSVKNFMVLLSNFFERKDDLELENEKFNQIMDNILIRLAEYTESKKISIFRKFGEDASVKINKEQFYLACLQIIKSWCENITEHGKIYITTKKNNEKIEIELRDSISGIPDEILKYIFEPSNPLEHEWEFGLVLANKIINDHKGKISVSRSEGLNTLTITLPAFEENEFNNLINERII